MSEVIRDAVIRLRLEQQKAKLEAPQMADLPRGYQEQKKAADEAAKSVANHAREVHASTQRHVVFGVESLRAFRHASEGTLQLTRGIALMSALGQEDTRKLLESFVKIEAAIVMAKGTINLAKFAAGFGPLGAAVAAVTATVGLGYAAWNHYANSLEAATKKATEARDALRKLAEERARTLNRHRSEDQRTSHEMSDLAISLAASPTERGQLIAAEVSRAARDASSAAAERARLDRVQAKTPGAPFDYVSPEMEQALKTYGGYQGIKERHAALLGQQESAIRREIQQRNELRQLRRDEQDALEQRVSRAQAALFAGTTTAGPLAAGAGLGAAAFSEAAISPHFAARGKFEEEFRKTFIALLETLEQVNSRRVELERNIERGQK